MNKKMQQFDAAQALDEEQDKTRRRFLRQSVCAAGLVLALPSLPSLSHAAEKVEEKIEETANDLVLKTGEHEALNKVGGSEVVATEAGKIIVARTGESSFAACSAICTHKGAVLEYDHGSKQFVCPLHGSQFDLNGKVVGGPAKTNLKKYTAQTAAVVALKPEA